MSLFSIAFILFFIMDPVGNIPCYISQLNRYDAKKQLLVTFREMGFALVLMLLFNYIGDYIFIALDVSEITVSLASGAIIFLVALQILFPSVNSIRANLPTDEPYFVPLAIPLIAGPSLLATIMLFSHMEKSNTVMLFAILLAWAAALVVLLIARPIKNFLGENGLGALERLMGMILVMVGIQRFMEGIQLFIESTKTHA